MTVLQNYANTCNSDAKKIMQEANDVVGDAKSMMNSGASMAGHIRDDAVDITHSAICGVKSFVAPYVDRMEKEIKVNPVQSIALAFGAGALISFFMRRA